MSTAGLRPGYFGFTEIKERRRQEREDAERQNAANRAEQERVNAIISLFTSAEQEVLRRFYSGAPIEEIFRDVTRSLHRADRFTTAESYLRDLVAAFEMRYEEVHAQAP
jgi:hypothetical protein